MRSHPKGSRLPALEQNILKYRALEMIIILFYVENLKRFVLDSIRFTDRICRPNNQRIPVGAKKVYEKAWAILVAEGILSQDESDEVQRIVNYRNDIGHRVHELTCDLSHDPFARRFSQWKGIKYDYQALKKLKSYKEKIERGLESSYGVPLSDDHMLFVAAEKTYEQELRRLDLKIKRQLAERDEENNRLKVEMALEDSGLLDVFDPDHEETAPTESLRVLNLLNYPSNKAPNGALTKRGKDMCYWLFDHGRSALAVAYLMQLSHPTAVKHRRVWEKQKADCGKKI